MQVFHDFFKLPNVGRETLLKAMDDCVGLKKKSNWRVEDVSNTEEPNSSADEGSKETAPVRKRGKVAPGKRMQAFVLGVFPPDPEKRTEADKKRYVTDCIIAARKCVLNPVKAVPKSQEFGKGKLVSFVLTHCISAVNVLLGNAYVITGTSLMFFSGEEVTAQPWHLDYSPVGHEEDDKLHWWWDEEEQDLVQWPLDEKGKLTPTDESPSTSGLDEEHPLLFIFSFSDNYFLEHIPGPAVDSTFSGYESSTIDNLYNQKTPLRFGSLAVFAPWCIHRGPAKETTPEDQQVFRFHLFASPKGNIRGHNNEIFKVRKSHQ